MNGIIMPLYLAPELNWFRAISREKIVPVSLGMKYNDDPGYNRLSVAGPHGRQDFSIPLVAESRKSDIASLRISYAERWSARLINALRTAYGKSPFYEYYDYKLEPILSAKHEYLYQLNQDILLFMMEAFKFGAELNLTAQAANWNLESTEMDTYYQVFASSNGFIPGLSALDYLFNESWDIRW